MFHNACLKSWFENIRITRDLTCPLCNTVITDTSQIPNDEKDQESNEVSASIVLETPEHQLQQHQNQITNNVALITCVESDLFKNTARADSDECIVSNPYEENELNEIYTQEVKSLRQKSNFKK